MQSKYNINLIYWLLKRNIFTHQNNKSVERKNRNSVKKIWHKHSLYTNIWFLRTKNSSSSYLRTSWPQLDHTATPSSLITTKLYQFKYRHATTQADWTKILHWFELISNSDQKNSQSAINCEIMCTTFQ